MTGVTAGAMGFIGAAAFIGFFFAAFRAGFFFFAAFLAGFFFEAFFFEDFLEDFFFEDFFFAAFFFATRFFAARFLEDFFFAFFAVFFFAAFFFAAMFNSFQCWTDVDVRGDPTDRTYALPSSDSHRMQLVRPILRKGACQA